MKKTLPSKDKSKSRPKPTASKRTNKNKYPKVSMMTLSDGSRFPLINLGYKTNAVELVKENR